MLTLWPGFARDVHNRSTMMFSARDDEKLGRGAKPVYLAMVLLFCCLSGAWASLPASRDKPQAAAWVDYDLVVKLQHLPKRYSCDELWYKFSDMLRAIGARPRTVFPYRCEAALGPRARSPEVHLQFSFPEAPKGAAEAGLSFARKTIALMPGHPATLTDEDCVLLRQLKGALLPAIPVKVVSYRMSCEAPGQAKPLFKLLVSAWAGSNPSSKLAAANAGSDAHPSER